MTISNGQQATQREVIRCATWPEFVARCADDLGRGGMYIITSEPHRVWTVIDVLLSLPAGHEVQLQGRVVHVMDPAAAAQKQMQPGIGVEFVDLNGPRAAALGQLLEYARTEGNQETPSYTFAQWLAMTAVSQGPSELMASLPPPASSPAGTPARRRRTDRPSQGHQAGSAAPAASPTSQSTVRMRQPTTTGRSDSVPAQASRAPAQRSSQAPAARSLRPPQPRSSQAPKAEPTKPAEARSSQAPAAGNLAALHPTRKPTELKLGMTHVAHRRHKEAQEVFRLMLDGDPNDRDAQLWMYTSCARAALAGGKNDSAIGFYRKALAIDQNNREASDKIRELQRAAKLGNIPFGRFFGKK